MKKLMFAAAAIAAGVAVADVTSANIVGYNTIQIKEQWTIMAVNFAKADGTNYKINEAFPAVNGMTQSYDSSFADQIQIQNGTGGYNTYFLSNGKNSKNQPLANVPPGTWVDMKTATTPATVEMTPGTAFWYGAKNYATPFNVTVAGGVPVDASKTISIKQTNTHIANPYPFDLALNGGIGAVTGMTQGYDLGLADQIQIQNGTGGYNTYFLSNGKNSKNQPLANVPPGTWVDMKTATTPATAKIPVGKGAWYIRKGATDFDITINPAW